MATMRWLLPGLILLASPLIAETPPAVRYSHDDVRRELLGRPFLLAPDTGVAAAVREGDALARKAPGLAAVYSLILPGMGELYAGDFSSGKYFLIGEGILWITFAAFEIYGDAVRDDARTYAVTYAGVSPAGKNDQFSWGASLSVA